MEQNYCNGRVRTQYKCQTWFRNNTYYSQLLCHNDNTAHIHILGKCFTLKVIKNWARESRSKFITLKHTGHLLMLLINRQNELNVQFVTICNAFLIQWPEKRKFYYANNWSRTNLKEPKKKEQTIQKHMIEGIPQGWVHDQLPKDVSHPISWGPPISKTVILSVISNNSNEYNFLYNPQK